LVETIREKQGRGNWRVTNNKLRETVETIRDRKGRGSWGAKKQLLVRSLENGLRKEENESEGNVSV